MKKLTFGYKVFIKLLFQELTQVHLFKKYLKSLELKEVNKKKNKKNLKVAEKRKPKDH